MKSKHIQHLLPYQLFEATNIGFLTTRQKNFLNDCTNGSWTLNPSTNLVDIAGNFYCVNQKLDSFLGVFFGRVSGSFDCSINNIVSLKGAPRQVKGSFICKDNELVSLKGAPLKVGKDFDCMSNKLVSLEGAPQNVGRKFACNNNKLVSLEGAPQTVEGDFNCGNNQLTTLTGAPPTVGGNFICYNNKLVSLKGAPQKVGEGFDCQKNKLVSLEGAPQEVEEGFNCSYNQLVSLKGAPQKVWGNFDCYFNHQLVSLEGAPQKVGGKFWGIHFRLEGEKWNLRGWTQLLRNKSTSPRAKKLILTLIGPDFWNSQISAYPEDTLRKLVSLWDLLPDHIKRGIQIPPNLVSYFEYLKKNRSSK